jgi:SAM-dependent methyltransferase
MDNQLKDGSQEKWDRRYREQVFNPRIQPTPFLKAHIVSVKPGRALCLAAGNGRNAVFLAERGFKVDAVDISAEGLELCTRLAETRGVSVTPIRANLAQYAFGEGIYDLVTKFYYYQPQLLAPVCGSLRPGGRIMFQTFSRDQLAFPHGPRSLDHLAKPEEILPAIGSLRLRFYEDRILEPSEASSQEEAVIRLIAEKEDLRLR